MKCANPTVIAAAVLAVVMGAWNATLFGDDLFLLPFFEGLSHHPLAGLKTLFFGLDLGGHEYRTYGLSRILHFALWFIFGSNTVAYGALIGTAQAVSGVALHRLLLRLNIQDATASALAVLWILSPFAVTTCFHYYSYLILPYQILIVLCLYVNRPIAFLLALAIAFTGEAHLIASVLVIGFVSRHDPKRAALLIATIVFAIALHRYLWSRMVVAAPPRFDLRIDREIPLHTMMFMRSIWNAAAALANHVFQYNALASMCFALVVVLRTKPENSRPASALLVLFLAGIAITGVVTVLSGQGGEIMPRRYGYVPLTLGVMLVYSFLLCVPGVIPLRAAQAVASLSVACWLTLQFAVLPTIRAEDERVFEVMRKTPYFVLPTSDINFVSPGVRDHFTFDIIESPLSTAVFTLQFAKVALGAIQAGFAFDQIGNSVRIKTYSEKTGPDTIPINGLYILDRTTQPEWSSAPSIAVRRAQLNQVALPLTPD